MACPHSLIGDPSSCSQCRGATARIVRVNPQNGEVRVDGKVVQRDVSAGRRPLSPAARAAAKRRGE